MVHSDDTIATHTLDLIATNYRLPQTRDSFIEFIEKIAKQTIQLAKDALEILKSRIEQLFNYEKLFDIQQNGNDALDLILIDIEKLSENSRKGIGSCVQNHTDEIKLIIANGRADISQCILAAMGETDNINESLFPYVESISTLIKDITGVFDKCSTSANPISVAVCITQHVREKKIIKF